MRLINSTTHELKEVSGEIPSMRSSRILGRKKELSFQDIQERNAKDMAEFAKVKGVAVKPTTSSGLGSPENPIPIDID
jgi:hypothetical protein